MSKADSGLHNDLRAARLRLGWTKQELARRSGVTRQTVSGIEEGDFAPTAVVALKLARALGQSVEELFWLEEDLPTVEAHPAGGIAAQTPLRVAMAEIDGRWVAHPLDGDAAFRAETVPADGVTTRAGGHLAVRLLDRPERVARSVILAGCTPALSLWARSAERYHPGLRVHWIYANSTEALDALLRGEVHAAGLHLYDPRTGEFNAPFVRAALRRRKRTVALVNLGVWEEGLLLAPGNPLEIRTAAGLARPGLRLVNREEGAGSRLILDSALAEAGIPPESVGGYQDEARSHQEVARRVRGGHADAGVSTNAMAAIYGLAFVPLREVRYDLAFWQDHLTLEPVQDLLSTLNQRWVRSQLQMLGGYNTTHTGEVVAEVTAGL